MHAMCPSNLILLYFIILIFIINVASENAVLVNENETYVKLSSAVIYIYYLHYRPVGEVADISGRINKLSVYLLRMSIISKTQH